MTKISSTNSPLFPQGSTRKDAERRGRPQQKEILNSFREELTYELTELYVNNKGDELNKELHAFKRFKKLLQNETEDNLSYQVGIIIGMMAAIESLAHKSFAKNKFNKKMSAWFSTDINRKIVMDTTAGLTA